MFGEMHLFVVVYFFPAAVDGFSTTEETYRFT